MGTYATTTGLATLFIGTTFDSLTTSLADKCITDAENEIRKYLSKRYDVGTGTVFDLTTTASTPPIVETWAEQWAEGLLYIRQSRGGKESISRGEKMIAMVKENLEDVAAYKLDVIGADGSVVDDSENTSFRIQCNTSDYAPTFDEDDPLNWKVDPDKLDDIESERD